MTVRDSATAASNGAANTPFFDLPSRQRLVRLRRLAQVALDRYGLGGSRLQLLSTETNAIFRVDTAANERFVLRINKPGGRSLSQIRSELWWLEALRRDTDLVFASGF